MKKTDYGLLMVSIIVLFLLLDSHWIYCVKAILGAFLIIFALYWKLVPYKSELTGNYHELFSRVDRVFLFLLKLFKSCPRIGIGNRLQLDTSYLVIILIVVIILIFL